VLWNEDAELAKQLKKGSKVKIINGYVKSGLGGLEINLGRWGMLEIQPDEPSPLIQKTEDVRAAQGILLRREPTRAFFKDNGEFGFVTTITIKENDGEKQLTLWGEKVKEIQQFKIGETIKITNIDTKQYNGNAELHLNGQSQIMRV
jgi:ssDNA-binding replication factor A large subunit